MLPMNFFRVIVKAYHNAVSWSSNGKKIVVFESDDWGTLRMPNKHTYNILSSKNSKLSSDPYMNFDTLENEADLSNLFGILGAHRGSDGNNAVFTANTIVANPVFEKIASNDYNEYFYEPFTETIKKSNNGSATLRTWMQGVNSGFFFPQLHGREHLHALLWLSELRNKNNDLITAFHHQCFSVPFTSSLNRRRNLMAALDYYGLFGEADFQRRYIQEAAQIFARVFGFHSESFIAPAYIWRNAIEGVLASSGMSTLQGIPFQYDPTNGLKYKKRLHYTGQRNLSGQMYLVRNCFFEPNLNRNIDNIDKCLNRISDAFTRDKPAIIGSHRLNYVGGLDEKRRDNNLRQLNKLLKSICTKWPDVIFMTTPSLSRKMKYNGEE